MMQTVLFGFVLWGGWVVAGVLLVRHLHRHEGSAPDPIDEDMKELLELVVKSARRCAYDLHHAAGMIDRSGWYSEYRTVFAEKSNRYLTIFNPADDGKSYRAKLHNEIDRLEMAIEKVREYCRKHGIDEHEVLGELPF